MPSRISQLLLLYPSNREYSEPLSCGSDVNVPQHPIRFSDCFRVDSWSSCCHCLYNRRELRKFWYTRAVQCPRRIESFASECQTGKPAFWIWAIVPDNKFSGPITYFNSTIICFKFETFILFWENPGSTSGADTLRLGLETRLAGGVGNSRHPPDQRFRIGLSRTQTQCLLSSLEATSVVDRLVKTFYFRIKIQTFLDNFVARHSTSFSELIFRNQWFHLRSQWFPAYWLGVVCFLYILDHFWTDEPDRRFGSCARRVVVGIL